MLTRTPLTLLGRQAALDSKKSMAYLLTISRLNGIVPFVGAGISIPYGFPGWTSFLIELGRDAGIEKQIIERVANGEYEEAVDDIVIALGKESFSRKHRDPSNEEAIVAEGNAILSGAITRTFGLQHTIDFQPGDVLRLLPRFAKGPVITTNFDRVLESAYEAIGSPFIDKIWGNHLDTMLDTALRERRRVLLKIHGDVEDVGNRVLSLKEYTRHYGSSDATQIDWDRPLPRALRYVFRSTAVLFLGCSLHRDRTVEVLRQIRSSPNSSSTCFAVLEWPGSEEEYKSRIKQLWLAGIFPIWYPRGRHDQISDILKYLAEESVAGPRLPKLFYVLAFVLLFLIVLLSFGTLSQFRTSTSIRPNLAHVDGVQVETDTGRMLWVKVHYRYDGNPTDPALLVLRGYDDKKMLVPLRTVPVPAPAGRGLDVHGYLWTSQNLAIDGISACIAKEEAVEVPKKSTFYGDPTVIRDIDC
jgi:hypothetical protein